MKLTSRGYSFPTKKLSASQPAISRLQTVSFLQLYKLLEHMQQRIMGHKAPRGCSFYSRTRAHQLLVVIRDDYCPDSYGPMYPLIRDNNVASVRSKIEIVGEVLSRKALVNNKGM